MNLLDDIITYVRRLVKTPSDSSLSNDLIIDYINRFWLMDVNARMELFDLKTVYSFQTFPGRNRYNVPLYNVGGFTTGPEPGNQLIGSYPVYSSFTNSVYTDSRQISFYTERSQFFSNFYTPLLKNNPAATASIATTYSIQLNSFPLLSGHVDISGIVSSGSSLDPIVSSSFTTGIQKSSYHPSVYISATGSDNSQIIISDTGQFLDSDQNYGLLMNYSNVSSLGAYSITSNTINYTTGAINVTFPSSPLTGSDINVSSRFFTQGEPAGLLLYNNVFEIMPPPDKQYTIQLEAYLSPAAMLSTASGLVFGYMSEYIARGATRKILADTGDFEQFQFYEPLFREQELLVWKRSQRQVTSTRTPTIFSGLEYNNYPTRNGL